MSAAHRSRRKRKTPVQLNDVKPVPQPGTWIS